MSGQKVLVILGSTRDGRNGLRVAKLMISQLQKVGLAPVLIDPLELDVPVLRQPFHFMPPDAQKQAPEWMKKLNEEIIKAAGFLLVSSEYNCTIPPALTNVLDHFSPDNYRHKPVSIATYSLGSFGGTRARVALQPFTSELGLVCLPSAVTIPSIAKAEIAEDGTTTNERILKSAEKMVKELDWYIRALQEQRKRTQGYPN